MREVEVSLKWLSKELISPDDVGGPDFFDKFCKNIEHSNGLIYFRIHNGKVPRIAYIGETGRYDGSRLVEHRKHALKGRYSAVNCGDGDLLAFYDCHKKYDKNCLKGQPPECPSQPGKCQYFKPSKDKSHDRDDGRCINSAYWKSLRYIFAEIATIRIRNSESDITDKLREQIRKEIEGLFMWRLLGCVLQKRNDRECEDFLVRAGFLWGNVNKYPFGKYTITMEEEHPETFAAIMKDELGWNTRQWNLYVEDKCKVIIV